MRDTFKLVIAITVSELAGIVGSIFTSSSVKTWYVTLEKPLLNPPSWVFGPVWIALYALMGIAAYLVWKNGLKESKVRIALGVFGIQLMLNTLWSITFFGLGNLALALANISALFVAIIWTLILFYRISRRAGYLLVPYLLWVGFATYLNVAILILNS